MGQKDYNIEDTFTKIFPLTGIQTVQFTAQLPDCRISVKNFHTNTAKTMDKCPTWNWSWNSSKSQHLCILISGAVKRFQSHINIIGVIQLTKFREQPKQVIWGIYHMYNYCSQKKIISLWTLYAMHRNHCLKLQQSP